LLVSKSVAADVTVAVFEAVPVELAVVAIVIKALPPALSVPKGQVIVLLPLQVP
jgi:hypothetical protein